MNQRERGRGRVYLRGKIYWIQYSFRGNVIRESAETTNEKMALKFLDQRLKQKDSKPNFIGPKEERWILDDLEKKIEAYYIKEQNRSFDVVQRCLKHVKDHFPFHRVVDIGSKQIEDYQLKRLKDGAQRSTINREVAYLRLGFNLMLKAGDISSVPSIKLFEGENVRKGFIAVGDFRALLAEIHDADAHDVVEFLYNSGWRSREAMSLEWSELDPDAGMITLSADKSKNKEPRKLPVVGAIREVIERRIERRDISCNFIFHRKGKPVRSFRKAFKAAAKEIGQPELIPHDMRRSAVRNFRRAGLKEIEGMMLSGHKTNSVFKRYNIIDEQDLREIADKAARHVQGEAERKVVPLKKQA